MQTAHQVVATDLDYICEQLAYEFGTMAGKRLFISGGAGFLGYYLVQAMLHWNQERATADGIHITVCDSFIRGVPDWLEGLRGRPSLELLHHDITQPLGSKAGRLDYVIHAASIASPTYYRRYPIETMDANVHGLRLLLDHCVEQQKFGMELRGFLFFSTSEIYGDPPPDQIPTAETYRGNVSCTGPRACYDESKRFGETLCVNFAQRYNLPITIARPFNNYGPGLKITDRRIIADLSRNILAGEDLVLFSDGSPTRTFCYVADAVVGYYKVLVRGEAGEPYNIGSEAPEITMVDLAERLAQGAREQWGYSGRVVRQRSQEKDYLTDNPQRRCPSICKARSQVGFNPSISLDDGLARTLVWYRENSRAKEA